MNCQTCSGTGVVKLIVPDRSRKAAVTFRKMHEGIPATSFDVMCENCSGSGTQPEKVQDDLFDDLMKRTLALGDKLEAMPPPTTFRGVQPRWPLDQPLPATYPDSMPTDGEFLGLTDALVEIANKPICSHCGSLYAVSPAEACCEFVEHEDRHMVIETYARARSRIPVKSIAPFVYADARLVKP